MIKETSSEVVQVKVYLDDNVPEYMQGIIRCGQILSVNALDKETDHQELINNVEFHSNEALIAYVAKKLNIDKSIVEIISDVE